METNEKHNEQEEHDETLHANRDVSGNDMTEENQDNKHHQQFGSRRYESHSNHSSNDDQPMTDTSPTGSSPTLT